MVGMLDSISFATILMTPKSDVGSPIDTTPVMKVAYGDIGNGFDTTSAYSTLDGTGSSIVADERVGCLIDVSQLGGLTVAAYMGANSLTNPLDCPGTHIIAPDLASRPIYRSGGYVEFDSAGTSLLMTTPTGGFTGTQIARTTVGEAGYSVNIPAGISYGYSGQFDEGNTPRQIKTAIFTEGRLTDSEADAYIVSLFGSQSKYTAATNLVDAFRARTDIVGIFPLLDFSNVTLFSRCFWSCSNIEEFQAFDLSSAIRVNSMFRGCTNITAMPSMTIPNNIISAAQFVEGCSNLTDITNITVGTGCTELTQFAANCALTQASVDHILTMLDSNGDSGGTVGLDGGTNAAPSATGATAASNLTGRGWTVLTN